MSPRAKVTLTFLLIFTFAGFYRIFLEAKLQLFVKILFSLKLRLFNIKVSFQSKDVFM